MSVNGKKRMKKEEENEEGRGDWMGKRSLLWE